ncbi:Pre-mRNA splicing factor PRP21 like protein-domain-containing protein [Diplogelasinospora grovesii]|uniref:Pre-mRNA splicing factor PRP21 like protein-domain-containing protein n=1 Tax=Diplogelasinospora grovesii TaxID=303347 RepID=A0AAN6S824_9PEZI|nr:Pre-mRNA splicing factor PRP21 like protein-domain-containing protein [Diplogelasinospora grovesii]
MAVAGTNGDVTATAAAALENIKPPPGIVIPPPGEIREAIEKTAGYVIRGGSGLEERIRENHGKNPKFNFLMTSDDPYNAYYEWRKQEIKAGRGTVVSAGRVGEAAAAKADENKGPPKPVDFQFSARMPRMSQKDLEIVRVTALFAAKNGRPFLTQLAAREAANPQYQFLIPNHTYHNFFQSMVDQYSILLRDSGGVDGRGAQEHNERIAELRRLASDRLYALRRAKQRAEYSKWLEAEKLRKQEEEEAKKLEFARIDWNDFIVAETIVFTETDDQADLPPPTTLNDIQYASLEEKNRVSVSANLRIEEAVPFEDTTYNAYPLPVYGVQVPYHPAPSAAQAPPTEEDEERAAAEEQRTRERLEAEARKQQAQAEARSSASSIKIKDNYVPRAAQRAAARWNEQKALCPNCNQQIPYSELEEHMRIELLDPRWKEQKAKSESKYASTNLYMNNAAQNLKRLASQRTDIFDVPGQTLSEEEEARRKKVALHSFDGNPDAKSHAHSLNLDEQIRALHNRYSGYHDRK